MNLIETQKHYKIKGDLTKIRDILSKLELYGEVHPLIIAVKNISEAKEGQKASYLITERPYRWIPFNIQYLASVTTNGNCIEYIVSELPLTKANLRYELMDTTNKQTEIDFTLQITSKMPGKRILLSKMIKAQDDLMKSMENEILRQTLMS